MRRPRLWEHLRQAIARRARTWAEEILEQSAPAASAVELQRESRGFDAAASDYGEADDARPPAHWLAELRERAPHLLEDEGFWQRARGVAADSPFAAPSEAFTTPAASPPPAASAAKGRTESASSAVAVRRPAAGRRGPPLAPGRTDQPLPGSPNLAAGRVADFPLASTTAELPPRQVVTPFGAPGMQAPAPGAFRRESSAVTPASATPPAPPASASKPTGTRVPWARSSRSMAPPAPTALPVPTPAPSARTPGPLAATPAIEKPPRSEPEQPPNLERPLPSSSDWRGHLPPASMFGAMPSVPARARIMELGTVAAPLAQPRRPRQRMAWIHEAQHRSLQAPVSAHTPATNDSMTPPASPWLELEQAQFASLPSAELPAPPEGDAAEREHRRRLWREQVGER